MLILLTIFLLLFIPIAMLILHLAWPKFSIQGFMAVLAVLAGLPIVFLARQDIPQTVTLLSWQPGSFFPNLPALLIDDISWYFSLALMSLALSSIVTSIAHLGRSRKNDRNQGKNKIEVIDVQELSEKVSSSSKPTSVEENKPTTNWQSWAGTLVLTSLGLVAVNAGNMLTLLLAWAALDLIELVILLVQVLQSKSRERIILVFSLRMAGIGMVLLAWIIPWSQGISLNFNVIDQSIIIYLLLAAGLRLVALALQFPLNHQHVQTHELETILRLVPAAASYILLVRVAHIGVLGAVSPLLLGGLIFSMSIRHKNLIPIVFIGFIGFSALPFSPTWLGTDLYQYGGSPSNTISPPLFYMLSFAFLLSHSLFLAGFIRNILRDIFPYEKHLEFHVERWVWFLFPAGLILIIVTHFLIGILLFPALSEIQLTGWIMGAVAVAISGIIWYLPTRYFQGFTRKDQAIKTSAINKFLSLKWLYRFFWKLFHTLVRLAALISTILEGDGGILWAFVLFALIFVFLLR